MNDRFYLEKLFQDKNYTAAESLLIKLIADAPQDGGLYTLRALARLELGRHRGALSDVFHALALNPYDSGMHALGGLVFWRSGEREVACGYYQSAISFKDRKTIELINYANLLVELGRYELALAHFKEALNSNPDSDERFHAGMGITMCELRLSRLRSTEGM